MKSICLVARLDDTSRYLPCLSQDKLEVLLSRYEYISNNEGDLLTRLALSQTARFLSLSYHHVQLSY